MGQNNQKDQKGPKMTAAVMLLQNNQKNWSLHISHTILKVRFFWDTLYMHVNNLCINFVSRTFATERTTYQRLHIGHIDLRQCCSRYLWTVVTINYEVGKIMKKTTMF